MLSPSEKLLLREAIYVARVGAPRDLDDALRILNEQVIDDTYPYSLIGAQNIDLASSRSPGYEAAWDSLRRELKVAPPIESPSSPEPAPHEESYPHPPVVEPTADEFEAAVLEVLRKHGGQILRGGKTGFGVEPVQDTEGYMTITGGIVGVSEGNFQNPVRHENLLDICNSDGGFRAIQYGRWYNGKPVRNTTNRRMSIFALFDSTGNTCINDDASEPGQNIYIVRDPDSKTVTIAAYKPGWRVRIVESSSYGAADIEKL
jgi:hypothetical protein